jgi:hypothetical protein
MLSGQSVQVMQDFQMVSIAFIAADAVRLSPEQEETLCAT